MLIELLKKFYRLFNVDAVHNPTYQRMPIAEQKAYLAKFADPKDDYERSYFKFKCFCEYCYYQRKAILILYNIGALFAYPVIFHRLKSAGANKKKAQTKCDAVVQNVEFLRNYDVLPDEFADSGKNIVEIEKIEFGKAYLTKNGIDICKQLKKKYFWQFYFRMIVMMKLAQYNQYLYDYNPDAIVFYSCEREFASPLQTMLCEREGSRYISFMHGDYLYNLCMAFQKYSHYYTWDEVYNRMFLELRCEFPTTVYQPPKLNGIAKRLDERECKYFATYYFADETRDKVERIRAVYREFEAAGLRCKIRPHPRYSNIPLLKEVFEGVEIEEPKEYSLADSITESLYTIGLNTTVLSQAYFSDKKVVIDDISSPEEYRDLQEKQYIMLNRPHTLLSSLAEEVKTQNLYDESYGFYRKK